VSDPTDEELAAAGRDREQYERLVEKVHNGNRAEAKLTIQALAAVRARHQRGGDDAAQDHP
jgi:hypothetical protein